MPFPYFQRQLSQEHPDINLYTLLGYCNWERLFLTLRFTFFYWELSSILRFQIYSEPL